ncbi:MAG: helix-turn-helix transcriptional regulator [Selenomonadales bacterium]|nr:helix-turn-helix transcriptional regulator [Selenomonadales bacterium]
MYRLIGRKIAYYRRLKGYTQVQLAQKVGISSNYLSQIECGRREKYSLHTLMMAACALEVKMKDLCE